MTIKSKIDGKMMVPRSRIPQLTALCPKCGGGTKVVMASPFTDGYHRRHVCKTISCMHGFYTLAPYSGRVAQVSPLPFKDHPLSEYDAEVRLQWWKADAREASVTMQVTVTEKPSVMVRMVHALAVPPEQRSEVEQFLASVHDDILAEVERMEAPTTEEEEKHDD